MVAGNSRGDAAADVFSLRYAAGRAACPHNCFPSCVSNVGFDKQNYDAYLHQLNAFVRVRYASEDQLSLVNNKAS